MKESETLLIPRRRVFIVRLWQESQGSQTWRAQILDVHSGKSTAIPDAAGLLAWIESQGAETNSNPLKRRGLI